jgi:predicted nuclease with TOPRIM domain
MSDEAPNAQADHLHSDEETVQLALAAAEAIKRLIAERNALRSRLSSREREVTRLRDHVTLIRDSYRRLATELITQLELVDNFDGEVAQETAVRIEFPRFLGNVSPKAT